MSDTIPQELQMNNQQIQYQYVESDQYTKRFVISDLSWNIVTAQDIFVLLNSFVPSNGQLISTKIYITNQGKQQMKQEEEKGIDLQKYYDQSVQYVLSQNPQYYKYYKKHIKQQNISDLTKIVEIIQKEYPQIQDEISEYQAFLYNKEVKSWYYLIAEFDSNLTSQTVANQVQNQFLNQDIIDCQVLDDEIYNQMIQQNKFNTLIKEGGYLKDECYKLPTDYSFDNNAEDMENINSKASIDVDFDKDTSEKVKFFKQLSKGKGYDNIEMLQKYLNLDDQLSNNIEYNEEEEEEENELEKMREKLFQNEKQDQNKKNIEIKFESVFDDKLQVKDNVQTGFDRQLKSNKVQEWQYNIQDKNVKDNNLKISKQLINYYKKICKSIENEDDQKLIKMLQKKKQNIERKYPKIQQTVGYIDDSDNKNEQIDKERFDFD